MKMDELGKELNEMKSFVCSLQGWIVILIICALALLWFFNSDEFKSSYNSAYDEGYSAGRDIATGGKSSRDVKLCSDQCVLTNDVCVAFMSKGMEWRDCGFICDCPKRLQECYTECEELYR